MVPCFLSTLTLPFLNKKKEKKKKKKTKKAEKGEKAEEAAPPEEPPQEPEPPPSVEVEVEEAPKEEAPPEAPPAEEGEAPVEGEAPAEGEEALEPPPAPKKKPKFFVHWNRKKARFYDYNWDYGGNYYRNLVSYIDVRVGDPRRMAFAERGIRDNVARRTLPDTRTSVLLDDVRRSIRNFELSQKTYMK